MPVAGCRWPCREGRIRPLFWKLNQCPRVNPCPVKCESKANACRTPLSRIWTKLVQSTRLNFFLRAANSDAIARACWRASIHRISIAGRTSSWKRRTASIPRRCCKQRTRFHNNVVCSDRRRVAGKQETPLFSRFCMIGVVTVQDRVERGRIHEDCHDPNASARSRSCSALTSLEPDPKRPAASRARLR
jgi:hypothetical protein